MFIACFPGCSNISRIACKRACFPFADAKIEPFFHMLGICFVGKIPKWNEWNEKVIFSGTSGMVFFAIPSPIRSEERKYLRLRLRTDLPFPCSFPFVARHDFSIRSPLPEFSNRPTSLLPCAGYRIAGRTPVSPPWGSRCRTISAFGGGSREPPCVPTHPARSIVPHRGNTTGSFGRMPRIPSPAYGGVSSAPTRLPLSRIAGWRISGYIRFPLPASVRYEMFLRL